jgi:hypothetical protein
MFLLILFTPSLVSASWFVPDAPPPFIINISNLCFLNNCSMLGPIYMNGYGIYDAVFYNSTIVNATSYSVLNVNGSVYAENFYGTYNWSDNSPYLDFDGNILSYNESYLNNTIDNKVLNANSSLKDYIDNQDILFNQTMTNYVNGVNNTMTNYVNNVNQSMTNYVNGVNNTMTNYVNGVNNTMTNYVNNVNQSMTDYVDRTFIKNGTDANLTNLWVTGVSHLGDITISAENITVQNILPYGGSNVNIFGNLNANSYNWTENSPYLTFDGTTLSYGESYLNGTINNIVVTANTSMKDYVDNENVLQNNSLKSYIYDVNLTMKDYVDNENVLQNNSLKDYVNDTYVNEDGDTMTGNLIINNANISANYAQFTTLNVTGNSYLGDIEISTDTLKVGVIDDISGNNIDVTSNLTLLGYWVNALFNWTENSPYTSFDGSTLSFNESYLNNTVDDISKVRIYYINVTQLSAGGSLSYISPSLVDFYISELRIVPTTSTNRYRSSMIEYPSTSNIIDKDRVQHIGTWDIELAYIINSQVQVNITNINIDENFNIIIKYLRNGVLP